jgi:hypothetical protein
MHEELARLQAVVGRGHAAGSRGAAASVHDREAEPSGGGPVQPVDGDPGRDGLPKRGAAELLTELQGMKLMVLRKRALSAGVSEIAVEAALEADNPKSALVGLLVGRGLETEGVGDLVAALRGGGDAAATAVACALEHIVEVLDASSSAAPRRSRKGLLELLDRVEAACDSIDVAWGDGVAACGEEELLGLGALLARASEIGEGLPVEELVSSVSGLLECVEQCGSAAVQAVSALQSAVGGSGGEDALVDALEMLRCLSPERQTVSSKEVRAAELVMGCLVPESGAGVACQLRQSGCMALVVLACRNGLPGCGTVRFVSTGTAMMKNGHESLGELLRAVRPDAEVLEELAACSAATVHGFLLGSETAHKGPAAARVPIEKQVVAGMTSVIGVSKLFTREQICRLLSLVMGQNLLEGDDVSLACGFPAAFTLIWYVHVGDVLATAIEMGVFSAAWGLYRRVCPKICAAEWWVQTSAVIDIQSIRMVGAISTLVQIKKMPSALIETSVLPASWWAPLLAECMAVLRINASAGLSAGATMPAWMIGLCAQIAETAGEFMCAHSSHVHTVSHRQLPSPPPA